jgi:predicted PurR-regulated permease PerM
MTPSSARWSTDTKRLVALFGVVLFGLAVYRFSFVLAPLAISLLLVYLLNPIVDFLERRLRFRRTIAVLALLLTVLAVLILLFALLAQSVIAQLRSLNLDLHQIGVQISDRLSQPLVVGEFRIDLQQAFDQLRGSLSSLLQPIVNRAVDLGADVAQGFVWLIFIFISAFYLLKDTQRVIAWLDAAMPPGFRADFVLLRSRIAQTWNNFFRGQLILGITMGVVVGLAMWAIGLPNALIIGVLFGVLEVVPNFGPVLASIPTVLIALFQGSNWLFVDNHVAFTVVVIILSFVLQQIENVVLVPRILGHHLNLHPVAVLVAVIAGASLAGVLGILLASPVLATLRDIGGYVFARMLDREPFQAETQSPSG